MKHSVRKKIAGLFLAALLSAPAIGQVQDEATTYGNGKVLLQQQRYTSAMAELAPLASGKSAYAPEASYLYALAALKAGKLQEAYQMLLQLQNQHPQWEAMPEADYLLANVLFEQGAYDRALSKLQELSQKGLASDAEGLKRFYLAQLNDRAAFEQLLQQYPSDKTVAQAFADKLVSGWYKPQDRQALERLVTRFNLDRNRYLSKAALSSQGFNVAVLFPFQLNQAPEQTARKSQFVTDMYAGMQLAQDSLKRQGININLFSYDAAADTASTSRILSLPELKQMDLVIGPIYKSTASMAARFASQNNVNVINPLSQDLEMAKGKDHVLLFSPSVATQARQAASYAYQHFSPKTAVILFENTKDDTTFAYFYRQQFLKLGGRVKSYKKISSNQTTATATLFNNLNLQDIGHMAVFSDKMTAAVNATSLLQGQPTSIPLMAYQSWLDISQITLQQLDKLEVYFISPKYIDKQAAANGWFRRHYISRYNLPPSVYAYTGFEMLYYFGTMLQQYGPQFNQQLSTVGIKPGVFWPGVGFAGSGPANQLHPDNQYVPITKLENLQLTVVNPAF